MPDTVWQTCPPELADDQALGRVVLEAHELILQGQLAGDRMINRSLAIQLRALRRIEDWRVLLLLTPWMLSRLLFPDEKPELSIPGDWSADERRDADYQVLGPSLSFVLLGRPQRAHLNYHHSLGHYLLQPICLDMGSYQDAESVFDAWNQVIRTRDENMEKAKRDCPLQKEVSRRELFQRIRSAGDGSDR